MAKLNSNSSPRFSLYSKLLNALREPPIVPWHNRFRKPVLMPPTLGPDIPPSPFNPLSRSSSSSSHTLPNTSQLLPASSSSSLSIPLDNPHVDVVTVEGLRHAPLKLEARRYKSTPFANSLLDILRTIRAPSWSKHDIAPDGLIIHKVSGSLTNAVFFVSCPSAHNTRTLLLRIYGPSSASLISRPRELHTLHVLSSKYHFGPRVYGTFENGRVEEYFDSAALSASDLRDPQISAFIGARMAELHGVDIDAVDYNVQSADGPERGIQLGVSKNVKSWLITARDVLLLPAAPAHIRQFLDLDQFEYQWKSYLQWIHQKEKTDGASRRVFSHNDAQYGNLLRLRTLNEGMSPHRQIIVVDFEYASPNPAPFDIANHFHEWTADYHGPTPHILDPARYPSLTERQNFYRAYLMHTDCPIDALAPDVAPDMSADVLAAEMARLEDQVRTWSPASHAMWAIWGIVQAREFLEGQDGEPEFDYLGYAQCRIQGFRRELDALGILPPPCP